MIIYVVDRSTKINVDIVFKINTFTVPNDMSTIWGGMGGAVGGYLP